MDRENYSETALKLLEHAADLALSMRHEFVTPEHLLAAMMSLRDFRRTLRGDEIKIIEEGYLAYFDTLDQVGSGIEYEPGESCQLERMLNLAESHIETSSAREVDVPQMVNAMLDLHDSEASYLLHKAAGDRLGWFMRGVIDAFHAEQEHPGEYKDIDEEPDYEYSGLGEPGREPVRWQSLVTCLNDHYASRNPLIGRGAELERTMQVLCRKEKNNPLHVGEPGVGKTALVWGLARRIAEGDVPERLKGVKIYMVDMTSLLAGTQYRGDFEKRVKDVMEGILAEGEGNIVYIDEIHMLVGAGATAENAMDASNILKPYLESGSIRFIGSTTYEEFNRQFSRSKGLLRRFQKIDIEEPGIEEAKNILRQLQPRYEEFHGVKYSGEAVDFAVEGSARHIPDRRLPDKAIDLLDETGAAMQLRGAAGAEVGVEEMASVLSKICKVDTLAVAKDDDYRKLENLAERLTSQIYGQDEAVRQVVESVQMARAGLLDSEKPLASLLFVGPTGVGKTEVARTLARELGTELIRFDMSEYQEKHAVAKLIGAPAGYVGYDDGGLLTDAVRKNPGAVLLLDEIEKAHEDIYNILLQVMDYGRLTDNKGRAADFRNVVLIMTSNAGARHASQGAVGFASTVTRGGMMMKAVKRTFKPEFLNRLSGTVVFNDMDTAMARLILGKKLRELEGKLAARNVSLHVEPAAFDHLLQEGFVAEYGARELDRVLRQQLNPLLMREILFGSLRSGGRAAVGFSGSELTVRNDGEPLPDKP